MNLNLNLNRHVSRLLRVCMTLIAPLLAGCAGLYIAKTIEGTVVDKDSGNPLAGVVIVAQWKLDRKFVGDEKALMNVMETVTDSQGRYKFPAWGPKVLPVMADLHQGNDPILLLFKSGYLPGRFNNPHTMLQNPLTEDTTGRRPPVGSFIWNGKELPLTKWDGPPTSEYISSFDGWMSELPHRSLGKSPFKNWRTVPRMVNALEREDKRIQSRSPGLGIASGVAIDRLSEKDKQFLRGFEDTPQ